jgi:hypothetical protein
MPGRKDEVEDKGVAEGKTVRRYSPPKVSDAAVTGEIAGHLEGAFEIQKRRFVRTWQRTLI